MSLEYCDKCDLMIDLDNDEHWEHFKDKWEEAGIPKTILGNLGKGNHKILFDSYQKEVDKFEKDIKEVILKQMKGGKDGK